MTSAPTSRIAAERILPKGGINVLKRVFLMSLALCLAVTMFTGVTLAKSYPSQVQSWLDAVRAKHGGTTLAVSFGAHPSTDAFVAMTPEFEKATGIHVVWDIINGDQLRAKHLMEYTARSSRYDVLMTDGFFITEYAERGIIDPLESYLGNPSLTPEWFDYEDILPAYRYGIGMSDGVIYGIPTAGESRMIAYRKDLFTKYGIKPPDTTDDLLKAAQFFKGREPGLYGIAMRAARGGHFSSGWLTVMYQFGGGLVDQKTWKVTANTPQTIASLQYFISLLQTAPPGVDSFTHEEAISAFMSGQTAMWWDATAIAPWIEDPSKSKVVGKVGYLPPVKGPAGRYGALAGWNATISSQSKNKEAAWAFIVWMTSRLNSKDYLDKGGVLCRVSDLTDPRITATNPEYYAALKKTFDAAQALADKGLKWIPPIHIALPVLERAGLYGSQALIGEMTPEEACRRIDKETEGMVKR